MGKSVVVFFMTIAWMVILGCSDDASNADTDSSSETDTGSSIETDTGSDTDSESGTEEDTAGVESVSECKVTADCQIVNDCCNCMAIGVDDTAPFCEPTPCFAPACSPYMFGSEQVSCVAGRCVLNLSCDDRTVTCKRMQPECPSGEEAVVEEDGSCWTDTCLPAAQCSYVRDCAACDTGTHCIEYETQMGPMYHCVKNTDACEGTASCDCLGRSVCVAPFDLCIEGAEGISCSCPVC